MPPTTTRRPTEGQMAASRIAAVRGMVNQGVSTPDARAELRRPISELPNQPGQRTGFTVPMPDAVPSEALNGNFSIQDVRANRDTREQADIATNQFNTDFNNLTSRIGNTTLSSPFTNPEETLNRLLLRGTTDTQQALDTQGQTQADNIRGFANEFSQAGIDARTQFRLPELQQELGNTRNQIAERRVKLRETLRDFETNAERRGVAREFVDSEKAKVQADAVTELADLAIIESAQLGNVNEAKAEVDSLLAEKKQAFEFENLAIEAEIARLDKMDTRESQARKEQLDIALAERKRNIETALANEKEQRDYMVDAAANGADQGTLTAIRNAKSPQEAAFLASPFIGRIQRMQAESQMYTQSLQQQKLLAELNPTQDPTVSQDIVAYGQQYAESGKLPSVSELKQSGLTVAQVTEYAKQAPKPEGTILSTNTGIKSTSISPTQEDGILALYDIQKKVADLKELDKKRQQGLLSAGVGKLFGAEDQQRYIDLRGEIVDLLARARTGAALTNQEEEFYASQLPGRIGQVGVIPGTDMGLFGINSQDRIDNFGTKIQGTLDTKLSGTGTVIQGYSKVNIPSLGEKTVGEIIDIGGTQYRVLPDGTLTDII